MKLNLLAAVALALATGCTAESHQVDADNLARNIRAVDGVADVDLTYAEPYGWESGDVRFDVRLAPDADPAQVVELFDLAYQSFRGDHESEEAELAVKRGRDQFSLSTFEPIADASEVTAAIRAMAEASLDLDVDGYLHSQEYDDELTASARVFLGKGADPHLVMRTQDDLEVRYPEVVWKVLARDA